MITSIMLFNNLQFVVCCVLFVNFWDCIYNYELFDKIVSENSIGPEFAAYTLVKPKMYHAREKREISSTKEKNGNHVHDLKIALKIHEQEHLLNLKLNKELIPQGYFHKYQHEGISVVKKPKIQDIELCQYQGSLHGVEHSWAALSTCDNKLSGVIFDGNELYYIESTDENSNNLDDMKNFNNHYLFKHSDLIEKKNCGYESSRQPLFNTSTPSYKISKNQDQDNKLHRFKRSLQPTDYENTIRGPFNANKQSRYLELVLVMDQLGYQSLEYNLQKVNNRCKNIANIINALYSPLNIFIALVGVVVWTETNEIYISENGDATLSNFLRYRRSNLSLEHQNDNAQLITRSVFQGGVVGKSLKGSICTHEFSGGVSTDTSNVVGLVATTIAHQLGHNFGMEHDTNQCTCPDDRCIMSSLFSSDLPIHWSSCNLETLANAFKHGMDYCLHNKPEHLFESPICGNGFVEPGEQCDCGTPDNCKNPCCNATTCMLHSKASCATGECCDLTTCHLKVAGTLCRSADQECDLPEFCTGQSEYCPNDVYKMNTEICNEGKAFCYQGLCRTHEDQCKILWGSTSSSIDACYKLNTKGTRYGNCGYDRLNLTYMKCTDEDVFCGMLHCDHKNDKLEFGNEAVSILSHSFLNINGSIISCRNAIVDLGLNDIDPGLTPNGAKCGNGKMCINQKCVSINNLHKSEAADCPSDCNVNGYCNSKGHCHCKDYFAPPNCDHPGIGGSVDSGPARYPDATEYMVSTGQQMGNRNNRSPLLNITSIRDSLKTPAFEEQEHQLFTPKTDLQVAIVSNRVDGIIEEKEVNILKQHIVEEMLKAMESFRAENGRSVEYHFCNTSLIEPGWFLITADDEVSRNWLLTEYRPLMINGVFFSAINAQDFPWPQKISFWLRAEEVDIPQIIKLLSLQNRQLNVDSWKLLRKEIESNGLFLIFKVEKKDVDSLKAAGLKLFYKLTTIPVNIFGPISNVTVHSIENKVAETVEK